MAEEGQQGEAGLDYAPQATEVADGVVFTKHFRRSRPDSSITNSLEQGQQAAGSGPAMSYACPQPAGASEPHVQSRAAVPKTPVVLFRQSGLSPGREEGTGPGHHGSKERSRERFTDIESWGQ